MENKDLILKFERLLPDLEMIRDSYKTKHSIHDVCVKYGFVEEFNAYVVKYPEKLGDLMKQVGKKILKKSQKTPKSGEKQGAIKPK